MGRRIRVGILVPSGNGSERGVRGSGRWGIDVPEGEELLVEGDYASHHGGPEGQKGG